MSPVLSPGDQVEKSEPAPELVPEPPVLSPGDQEPEPAPEPEPELEQELELELWPEWEYIPL